MAILINLEALFQLQCVLHVLGLDNSVTFFRQAALWNSESAIEEKHDYSQAFYYTALVALIG